MFPHKSSLYKHLTHFLPSSKSPSLSHLVDKCTSLRQLKQIHAHMIISARIFDNYAASRLLSFCALSSSANIDYAMKILNHIQYPNNFMYNTMIRAHASGKNPINALFLYMEMRRENVVPGKHTFPFLLKAISNMKSLFGCKMVHSHVMKFGLDSDLHVGNGLVRGYCVSGCLGYARQVFDEMSERNLSVWTSMICGYAQNECYDQALLLFDQMVGYGFEPNGATLASVLSACGRQGCLALGETIERFMNDKGMELGVILGTALVDMYAKNGALLKARAVFDRMQEKNVATWNAMIHGLAVHGHGEEALRLFRELEMEGLMPNGVTFVGVLSACCHGGFLEEGRKIFHSMTESYLIEPQIEHYGCMVDLLGRGGELVEAENLIRDMVWEADVMIWGALLTACRKCGNIEVAERAVKEIVALDPHNHGVHVVLSNMYAEVGRWDDVTKLRKVMVEGNLKKIPGWSSVDDAHCH